MNFNVSPKFFLSPFAFLQSYHSSSGSGTHCLSLVSVAFMLYSCSFAFLLDLVKHIDSKPSKLSKFNFENKSQAERIHKAIRDVFRGSGGVSRVISWSPEGLLNTSGELPSPSSLCHCLYVSSHLLSPSRLARVTWYIYRIHSFYFQSILHSSLFNK